MILGAQLRKECNMKEITLVQYIEARRTVIMRVEDDVTEVEAAERLNEMPLRAEELPDDVDVKYDWTYISDKDIENTKGEVILSGED